MRLDVQGHASIHDANNSFKDVIHRFLTSNSQVTAGRAKKVVITLAAGASSAVALDGITKPATASIVGEHPIAIDLDATGDDDFIRCREIYLINKDADTSYSSFTIHNLEENQTNTVIILVAGDTS